MKNEALEQRISDLTEENQTLKGTIEEQKKRVSCLPTYLPKQANNYILCVIQ